MNDTHMPQPEFKTCPECDGSGIAGRLQHGDQEELIRCDTCDGFGTLTPVDERGRCCREGLIGMLVSYCSDCPEKKAQDARR